MNNKDDFKKSPCNAGMIGTFSPKKIYAFCDGVYNFAIAVADNKEEAICKLRKFYIYASDDNVREIMFDADGIYIISNIY